MWNTVQNIGRAAYSYVAPSSWVSTPQQPQAQYYQSYTQQAHYYQLPPKPSPKKAYHPPQYQQTSSSSSTTYQLQKQVAVGVTVGAILAKLSPWDIKGYVKKILDAESEEKAVIIFTDILEEEDFAKLLTNGRQALSASDQAILIKFFAQVADKYPQYNLCASVTSIIAQLG